MTGPAKAQASQEPRTKKKVFRPNDVVKVTEDLTQHGFQKGSCVVLLEKLHKYGWDAKPYGGPESEVRSITEFEIE